MAWGWLVLGDAARFGWPPATGNSVLLILASFGSVTEGGGAEPPDLPQVWVLSGKFTH